MEIKLHEKRAMDRRFVLKDNFKVAHSGKKRWAGEHEVPPGCLQAGRSNACGLVVGLANGVGDCAKIKETELSKKIGNRRNIKWFSVDVSRNEDGVFWVHLHFSNDGRDDGVRFGRLKGKLGTICEPVNYIA